MLLIIYIGDFINIYNWFIKINYILIQIIFSTFVLLLNTTIKYVAYNINI